RVGAFVGNTRADRNERRGEERKGGNQKKTGEPYKSEDDARADPFRGSREGCEEKVPMAADNAYRAKAWECLSLAECLNDPEERAEMVRFARMWMSLAEPIEETRGSYEFPRGR